jgi:tRNA threonylcarbamoyladenosine biosynthesis protein TsaB
MAVLAFDTCFGACSAAASAGAGSAVASRFEVMDVGHAERLVPMIQEVLSEAGLRVGDLAAIGVTIGPGSFTGTRIGIAAARAFGLASSARVVGYGSLAVMARRAAIALNDGQDIAVAVDMRRGEIYTQVFDCVGLTPRSDAQVCTYEEAAAFGGDQPITWTGPAAGGVAALRLGNALPVKHWAGDSAPVATTLLTMTQFDYLQLSNGVSHAPSPLYLRPPDAKPSMTAPLLRR